MELTRIEDKQVYLNVNGKEVQHYVSKVKTFVSPDALDCLRVMLQSFQTDDKANEDMLITEVVPFRDHRRYPERYLPAKKEQNEGLINQNAWHIADIRKLPPNVNISNGRFVLAIKKEVTKKFIKPDFWFKKKGSRETIYSARIFYNETEFYSNHYHSCRNFQYRNMDSRCKTCVSSI